MAYTKQNFAKGQTLKAEHLNNMEAGIFNNDAAITTNAANIVKKQDALVSGTNIKTINGNSLLGSGDITVTGAGDIDLSNYATKTEVNGKQDRLISGTNIKTINGENILGLGNIPVQTTNVYVTTGGNSGGTTINDTWYYTPSEREGATIGSITYDIPNAADTGYGYAIANPTALAEICNKPINIIRWRLSPDETATSGTMVFAIMPVSGSTYTKLFSVSFTAKDINNKWVTSYLDEPITIGDGETFVIQPKSGDATPSSIKIGVLRASAATTTDKYINLYYNVPASWTNGGNYITRLGLPVDLGYREIQEGEDTGTDTEDTVLVVKEYVDEVINESLANIEIENETQGLKGLYFGYDFTDVADDNKPNFDTTALAGSWKDSNLSSMGYAPTIGFSNQVKINKYYVSDDIMTTSKVHLGAQDAVLAFCSDVRTDGAGGRTVGSLVKFDFVNKKLIICKKTTGATNTAEYVSTDFSTIVNSGDLDFIITVGRIKSRVFASIGNYVTGATVSLKSDDISAADFSPVGRFYDYLTFTQISGTQAYWQNLYTYVPTNVKIAFIGDSITQGIYLPSVEESWVNILGSYYGNCVSSGRGGAKIDFIIDALNDGLVAAYNPQYVVVTVGTNEGNTITKLQTVISKIKEIGATPIINCVSQTQDGKSTNDAEVIANINKDILALHQLGARFDIATGTNNDPDAVASADILHDAVHPNATGHALMAERFKFDLKGLK